MTVTLPALVLVAVVTFARGVGAARANAVRRRVAPAEPRTRRAFDVRRLWIPASLLIAGVAFGGSVGAVVALAAWLSSLRLGARRSRRAATALRDEQLADAVGALTSAVRAGLSVPQALAYAARESEAPLADDLHGLVTSMGSGVPVSDAIAAWTERVGTDDARLVGSVLELHRRSGGDLPTVLDQVVATIRERVAAAREVRALTAQARLSGVILGVLPIGFFAFLWVTSRREIEDALGTTAGMASIVLGLVLEITAFAWIRRLLEVA